MQIRAEHPCSLPFKEESEHIRIAAFMVEPVFQVLLKNASCCLASLISLNNLEVQMLFSGQYLGESKPQGIHTSWEAPGDKSKRTRSEAFGRLNLPAVLRQDCVFGV